MSAPQVFLDGRVTLHPGDCREAIARLADGSIDAVVTDPPYALVSIARRFGKAGSAAPKGDVYARGAAGFMGKQWDTGETAFAVDFWIEVFRVLKPGGHVVAMAWTRTHHRLACAIEDAGFEIRDQIAWAYGSGFPKSHNAGRGVDDALDWFDDDERLAGQTSHAGAYWAGWGTALKPAWEPILLARKPLIGTVAENVLRHGTGALNVDGCRIETSEILNGGAYSPGERERGGASWGNGEGGGVMVGANHAYRQPTGRWPANIVHDGSDEVAEAFGDAPGALRTVRGEERAKRTVNAYGDFGRCDGDAIPRGDKGSAARFFYSAKADADDRLGSKHPTVKPVDLMRWLCRLVTPPAGVVLDPFAGTGTTGEAAWREGFSAVLCEREADYLVDITRRMALATAGPATRRHEAAKARGRKEAAAPLFDIGAEAAE